MALRILKSVLTGLASFAWLVVLAKLALAVSQSYGGSAAVGASMLATGVVLSVAVGVFLASGD